ncbi:hypothetical protein DE146DRAFT_106815 [Phaeosphaeria sp. MPI-PUGE-AT-0046c]|nr:hypothetical protein DE146DRAFT_106815 [Phaeosphaeria sp. MPI-PUGE-AT-0046c]
MNRGQRGRGGHGRARGAGGPIGGFVRGIASGIGLATESYQHHKDKKAFKTEAGSDNENHASVADEVHGQLHNDQLSQQMDEASWELDEAQDQILGDGTGQPVALEDELADLANSFLAIHDYSPHHSTNQLALPVVITQRRPNSRTKGFVRAYSPLLEDVDINQTAFLDFVDKLNKSLAPSPWLEAINLAAVAGHTVPAPFTVMISIAAKKAADAASELHSRSKANKFLDQINETYFAPRGVVALIMTWKPIHSGDILTTAGFDMESSIAKASDGSKSRPFHESSSGATNFEWPETAPLVFPTLDGLPNEKQGAFTQSGKFVDDYLDKRARAKWAGENPDSAMANAMGKETFSSRYADPNHPASSGDPIALLTGGLLQAPLASKSRVGNDSCQDMHGGLQDRRGGPESERARIERGKIGQRYSRRNGRGGIAGSGIGPLSILQGTKKMLQDDVLYLMIVQRSKEE